MPKKSKRARPSNTSLEAMEAEVALAAIKLAHEQIKKGTVSSQVHTHFLKAGSVSGKLERRKLVSEIKLLDTRVDSIKQQKNTQVLYEKAMEALKNYGSAVVSNSGTETNVEEG